MDGFLLATCFRIVPPLRRVGSAIGRRLTRKALMTCLFAAMAAGDAQPAITCKPILSIKNVRQVRGPIASQSWTWTAIITADASYCATTSGRFEIDFIRIKEYSPDLQFTETYNWFPGRFETSVELAGDEAILKYRIGFIAPCVCRGLPFGK